MRIPFKDVQHAVSNRIAGFCLLLFLMMIPAVSGASSAQTAEPYIPENYTVYTNSRGAYTLIYPPARLLPENTAADETSQHFTSPDGRVRLSTDAQPISAGTTLADLYNRARIPTNNRSVTYSVLRDDWFVVSGYENGEVYYQKSLLDNGVLKSFQMHYPEELKPEFDAITAQISWSFRALNTPAQPGPPQHQEQESLSGAHALIHLSIATNGVHVWEPPGPEVEVGEPVFWAYTVVNMGDIDLVNVTLTDDKGTAVTCPTRNLSAGEAMSCIAQGVASPGLHTYHVSVHAEAPKGEIVTDRATAYYFGIEPATETPVTTP